MRSYNKMYIVLYCTVLYILYCTVLYCIYCKSGRVGYEFN